MGRFGEAVIYRWLVSTSLVATDSQCGGLRPHRGVLSFGAEQERGLVRSATVRAALFRGRQVSFLERRNVGGMKMRGPAALHGNEVQTTAKQDRRLSFDKSSPALPDRILLPLPVTDRVT
jgi:hypothetical protein